MPSDFDRVVLGYRLVQTALLGGAYHCTWFHVRSCTTRARHGDARTAAARSSWTLDEYRNTKSHLDHLDHLDRLDYLDHLDHPDHIDRIDHVSAVMMCCAGSVYMEYNRPPSRTPPSPMRSKPCSKPTNAMSMHFYSTLFPPNHNMEIISLGHPASEGKNCTRYRVQIQPRKHVVDHADRTAPTR